MNKDLNKRTKDFIEWELREITQKPAISIKKTLAITNDVIQEVDEENNESVNRSVNRGPRKPHEIIDKDFVYW